MLLIGVAPLLIASFAFNFNNFNLIFLLTSGRPCDTGADRRDEPTSSSPRPTRSPFGIGAKTTGSPPPVSVVVFMIVAGISAYGFRYTKAFEEVR